MFFVVYDFEPSNALSYFIKMFSVEMPVLGHPFKPISTSKKKWLWLVLPIHFFSAAPGCNAGVDIKGQPNKQDASSRNAAGFSILSASVFSVDNDSNPIIRVFWSFA